VETVRIAALARTVPAGVVNATPPLSSETARTGVDWCGASARGRLRAINDPNPVGTRQLSSVDAASYAR
jgi:hypothetical protein